MPGPRAQSDQQDTFAYPLESGSGFDGGVADHMSRPFGNWMSDNAVDISCPVHTGVCAVEDGTISGVTLHSTYNPSANPNGDTIYLRGESGDFAYMHLIDVKVRQGDRVTRGQIIGESGTANSVDHLHFAAKPPLNPEEVVGGAETDPGGSTGTGALGQFDEEDIFAIDKAASFSTMVELPGVLALSESIWMRGAKSIYNDEPLLTFIQELCEASLRHFQSLPNGAFYAFFPDHFGAYGHRHPYWSIDDVEIIDGQIELTDESLATHVFVVGDTNLTGDIDLSERVASKGVVTIFDAFMLNILAGSDESSDEKKKDDKKDDENLSGLAEATQFLRKYGIRPHYEEATFIRNPYFELFYAFTRFQYLWANQYRTQFTFTFMPELYPGGSVAFEQYGIKCYIDSVTHSFDYESGFTTQANLSSPSALTGTSNPLAQGMTQPFIKAK